MVTFSCVGDGTVPLVSLGYMCVNGWKDKRRNPAGIPVVTKEYKHLQATASEVEAAMSSNSTAGKKFRELVGTSATGLAASILREGVFRGGLDALRQAGGATADHVDIMLNRGMFCV